MTTRELAIAGAAILAIGFVTGRYSATSPRVEERSRSVAETRQSATDARQSTESEATAEARTVIVETRPDGTRIETRRDEKVREIVHEVEVVRTVEVEKVVVQEHERIVEAARPDWRVSVDLGFARADDRVPIPGIPRYLPIVAQLGVDRRVAGPVFVGAWASSVPAVGVRVAVEF